jgi:hypothetical protein
MRSEVGCWPISEVATSLFEVGLLGHSGLYLLMLSYSHFDPERTSTKARPKPSQSDPQFASQHPCDYDLHDLVVAG